MTTTEEFGLHRLLRRRRKHRSKIAHRLTVADIIPIVIPHLKRVFTPAELIDEIEARFPGLPYDERSVYAILDHHYYRVSKRTRHEPSYWTTRDQTINGGIKMSEQSGQNGIDNIGHDSTRPIRRRQLKVDSIALKGKVKFLLENAETMDLLLEKSTGQGIKGQPSQTKIADALGNVTNVRVSQLTRELRKEYPHIDELFTRHMPSKVPSDRVTTERAIGEWIIRLITEDEEVSKEYSVDWIMELATTIRDGKWGG